MNSSRCWPGCGQTPHWCPASWKAGRVRRQHPLDGIRFWFTGTEAETYALLDLAATRAPSAVSRIKRGLLLAQA